MAESVRFTISRHARQRMRQRGVTIALVRRALRYPDRVDVDRDDPDLRHALKRVNRRRADPQSCSVSCIITL